MTPSVTASDVSSPPPRKLKPMPPEPEASASWFLTLELAQSPPPPPEVPMKNDADAQTDLPTPPPKAETSPPAKKPQGHPPHARLADEKVFPLPSGKNRTSVAPQDRPTLPEEVLKALEPLSPTEKDSPVPLPSFPLATALHGVHPTLPSSSQIQTTPPVEPTIDRGQEQIGIRVSEQHAEAEQQQDAPSEEHAGGHREHFPEALLLSVDQSSVEETILPPLPPEMTAGPQKGKAAAFSLLQQPKLFATWLERLLQPTGNMQHLPDGWKSIQFQLDQENGILTLKARQQENGILIAATTNNPQLHAQMLRDMHRIEALLQEHYDMPVSFSMDRHSGEQRQTSSRQSSSSQHTTTSSLAEEGIQEISTTPIRRLTGTNEWIG